MKQNNPKNSQLSFHCWSRKKYAIFNSLRKCVKICTLSIAYSIVALPGKTEAQSNNDSLQMRSYELDDVVITAERTPVQAQQAARIVQIISKAEIDRAPAQNISDLLRFIAGADIRQRGPFGAQADISIRGGTYEQTLILLNGVSVNDPQTGHHNLNLPIDITSIERIEILEGSAAKSFGPNAFNGVINIITGNTKPNHVRLSVFGGQKGLYQFGGNISNTIGKFNHFISINRMSHDGYMYNTNFTGTNIFYQAAYNAQFGKFDLQTGYNNKEFGANGFYGLSLPNQYEYTKTEFLSVKFQSNSKIKLAPTFYYRRHRDDFEWDKLSNKIPASHHITDVSGVNLNLWTTTKMGKTSLGVDIRNEAIISNSYGSTMDKMIAVPHFDSAFYNKSYNRLLYSYYLEQSVKIKIFQFSGGLMLHHNSNLKTPGIFPGIDIAVNVAPHFKILASAHKTLRMPSYTEMFLSNKAYQGNEHLSPEEAINIESGLKWQYPLLNAHISLFERIGAHSIDWVKDSTMGKWYSVNHSRIVYKGVTTAVNITPTEYLSGYIQSIRISYTYLHADTTKEFFISKYALDYLKHHLAVSIDHKIVGIFGASWRVSHNRRIGEYPDAQNLIQQYKPFTLVDVRLYCKTKYFTVYTEASNLLNVNYADFGGIIQPGIWVKGGLLIGFDY